MRAVVHDRYGSSEILHLAEVARPLSRTTTSRSCVRAAGLDRGTWHLMASRPHAVRLGEIHGKVAICV